MCNVKERLLSNVKISGTGCWEWQKAIRAGYGALKVGGKVYSVHRLSYSTFVGEIPIGYLVCHRCDNKICINPDHLFVGTSRDNVMDAVTKGRMIIPKGRRFEQGQAAPNRKFSKDQIVNVYKQLEKSPTISLRKACDLSGVDYQSFRDSRRKKADNWYIK